MPGVGQGVGHGTGQGLLGGGHGGVGQGVGWQGSGRLGGGHGGVGQGVGHGTGHGSFFAPLKRSFTPPATIFFNPAHSSLCLSICPVFPESTSGLAQYGAEITKLKPQTIAFILVVNCCLAALTIIVVSVVSTCLVFVLTSDNPSNEENSSDTVIIGSVPVHNYHLRHNISDFSGDEPVDTLSVRLRGSAVYDWILELKGTPDGDEVYELCSGLPSHAKCVFEGRPSKGGVPMVILRATDSALESVLAEHRDLLDHAEADISIESTAGTDMETVELPWGLDRIDARSGLDGSYNSSGKGRGVHVYVVDSGIRFSHAEFMVADGTSRAVPTIEVLGNGIVECDKSDTECAADDHGHGTHVAGTVGGKNYGVAREVTLHSIKVVNATGGGKFSWFVEAMDWVAVYGQRPAIVSASLGSRSRSPSAVKAVAAAVDAGVTVVAGAGNDGYDACQFTPANAPKAITVGATDRNDAKTYWSNYGKCVDIFAPGYAIKSAGFDSDTSSAVMTGTSMATPHVSGAAALLLERDPSLTPTDIAEELRRKGTYGAVSGARDSANILLYTGDLPPMSTIETTTTMTTTLLVEIREANGQGCLKAHGPKEQLEKGTLVAFDRY